MLCIYCVVEADDDEAMAADAEVSVETQLSTYLELQMQMFRSVVSNTTHHRGDDGDDDDDTHVYDLVDRFGTLQDRQMQIIRAIQQSRDAAQQVLSRFIMTPS